MRRGRVYYKGHLADIITETDGSNLPDTSFQNILVIDRQRITLEQFSEMLQIAEGFNFNSPFTIHQMNYRNKSPVPIISNSFT